VLAGAAVLGIGAGLDHVIAKSPPNGSAPSSGPASDPVPFYGAHQAGVATPAQDYLSFATFDLTSETVEDLRGILQQWTAAAASLTVSGASG